MFAPRALVIKRWELGKLCVFGSEITLRVDRKFAHPISATFIHGYDLAFADVGDCVGAFQNLERFAGLIVDLEILRNSQRVPDCRIFRPKTIEREPTSCTCNQPSDHGRNLSGRRGAMSDVSSKSQATSRSTLSESSSNSM